MQHIVYLLILTLYCLSLYFSGRAVLRKWFIPLPPVLLATGSLLVGFTLGVPITYIFSFLFSFMYEPILWGVVAATGLAAVTSFRLLAKEGKDKRIPLIDNVSASDAALIVFSLIFSTWLMTKTFHGGADGQLFVGSNNVFDFGLSVAMMRSISWGTNIPVTLPFFAGHPLLYHFLFNFWTALLEYFGVLSVWAINLPSILSFSALLIVIYYFSYIVFQQKKIVGWIAVMLTITNSTMTFWNMLAQKGTAMFSTLWHLPNYPYAGPFDGSVISLFMTLNSYVNQRHLAFSIALGLFLYILVVRSIENKQVKPAGIVVVGMLTGVLILWNIAIFGLVVFLLSVLFIEQRAWKPLAVFVLITTACAILSESHILGLLSKAYEFMGLMTGLGMGARSNKPVSDWSLLWYLWQNLGLLPFVALTGYGVLTKQMRRRFYPFVFLIVAVFLFAGWRHRGFEQKFISFAIIGINVLAAVATGWLWMKKNAGAKVIAVILFFVLTVSGLVDLMPIKNEFAYPLVGTDSLHVISWIHANTPKDSVFVSYSDMIDPVVMAGRKNYFGFYGNIGWYDRSGVVRAVYGGDRTLARQNGISYVLAPKWQKSDFPYPVDSSALGAIYTKAYEDQRYIVFDVR